MINLKSFKISKAPLRCFATQFFVPKHDTTKSEDVEKISEFLVDKPRILVVTGAGISTESGEIFRSLERDSVDLQFNYNFRNS